MPEVITLQKEKFKTFMDIMGIISKTCDDVVIRDGRISQMSSKRTIIFDCDVTDLFGTTEMLISDVPSKEKLLMPFEKQQIEEIDFIIDTTTGSLAIQDSESKMIIQKPMERYLTNQYIPETNLTNMLNIRSDGKILACELPKHLIERVNIASDALQATLVRIDFVDGSAEFKIRPTDSNNTTTYNLAKFDNLEQEDLSGHCQFAVEPFQLGIIENFDVEYWFDNNNRIVQKLSTFLDSNQLVPMTIWCTGSLNI